MKSFVKPLAAAVAILLLLITLFAGYILNLKSNIADNLLRLHIVGASNSEYDQQLKLCVRDRILTEFSGVFSSCTSAGDAAICAERVISDIETAAKDELFRLGCDTDVTAEVAKCKFPTKSYGSITLPRGYYTALNVKIGSANGRNWWCVMYPPLCLTDRSVVISEPSLEKLKQTLSEDEYELICETKQPEIKIKFRIAELLGF